MGSVLRDLYKRMTFAKDVPEESSVGSNGAQQRGGSDRGDEGASAVITSQLNSFLGPIEHHVVTIQCILIWEKPLASCLTLILFNILFWVIVSFEYRFYFVLALGSALTYFYRTWVNQIWPEIRVPTPEGEDTEEWTPVNPQVLSVPEISRYLDQMIRTAQEWWTWLFDLRLSRPGTFCLLVTGILVVVALIGHYVTGVLIAYAILMTVMLGPGFMVHVYPHLKEFVTSDAIVGMCSPQMMDIYDDDDEEPKAEAETEVEGEVDSYEEFLPDANEETHDLLSKAALDSYDTDGESSSMAASKELGLEALLPSESNDSLAFRTGLAEFPSYDHESDDDNHEFSEDLNFPSFAPVGQSIATIPASIQFVSSHFDDEGCSDDDMLDSTPFVRSEQPSLLAATTTTTSVIPVPPRVITLDSGSESPCDCSESDGEAELTPTLAGHQRKSTFEDADKEDLDTALPVMAAARPSDDHHHHHHVSVTDEIEDATDEAITTEVSAEVEVEESTVVPRSLERLLSHQSDADLSDYEVVSESELS